MAIVLIWAEAHDGVIGKDGVMPWHLPEDLAHFRQVTLGGPVVMGRKTWESLPERFRPLPGRTNVVVTRSADWSAPGALVASSIEQAVAVSSDDGDVWVIGGAQIYAATMEHASVLEVTRIDLECAGDAFAPQIGPEWVCDARSPEAGWHESATGIRYRFERYIRASER